MVNSATARRLAADYPGVDISTAVSFTQFQSWIMSRNNAALADSVDAAIIRFKKTGAYTDLLHRYGL